MRKRDSKGKRSVILIVCGSCRAVLAAVPRDLEGLTKRQLGGQVLLGDAGVQDEEDSLQRLAIRQTLGAR